MSNSYQDEEPAELNSARAWSTPAQVAEHFQISAATVYAKIHSGAWECTKLGDRLYRFSAAQIANIEAGVPTSPTRRPDRSAMKAALKKIV